jgi:hypothetical protein
MIGLVNVDVGVVYLGWLCLGIPDWQGGRVVGLGELCPAIRIVPNLGGNRVVELEELCSGIKMVFKW